MTRINVMIPEQLTDQFAMAEYRELSHISGSLKRSLKSKKGMPKIPNDYTLGKNHVTFFYNKGLFLYRRYNALIDELYKRNYKLNPNRELDFDIFKNNGLYLDWTPTPDALQINSARIYERIMQKPSWYRYYSTSIVDIDYNIRDNIIRPNVLFI